MPYLTPAARHYYDRFLRDLELELTVIPGTAGDLNYLLTRVTQAWLAGNGTKYETLNAAVGALESAKLEFYRRKVAPYEDKKIEENGDVYY